MDRTLEHLRLLALSHYIVGGLTYLIALFPIFHLIVGIFLLVIPEAEFEENRKPTTEAVDDRSASETPEANLPDTESSGGDAFVDDHSLLIVRGMGGLFVGIAAIIMLGGFVLATLMIASGRCLSRRRGFTFCFAIAVLECATMNPLHGTLGVLTLVTLLQTETRELFPNGQGEDRPETSAT